MRFSEQCYYVFGDHTTFLTQNGTQGGATLFTLNEESEADFDSVSDFDRDSNLYAPMSFPQPPPGLHFANQQQHHHQHHQHNMQSHQPKIYSNMGLGIGGPVGLGPTGNYMSSSSSNATSNSTSTTSQNTTAQTIATASTSAIGI